MRALNITLAATAALALGVTLVGHVSASRQADGAATSEARANNPVSSADQGIYTAREATPDAMTPPVYGSFDIGFSVNLRTRPPDGDEVLCSVTMSASYSSTSPTVENISYAEQATGVATVDGSTAKCNVNVPHSWQFGQTGTGSNESLTGMYIVEIVDPTANAAVGALLTRSSSGTFVNASTKASNLYNSLPASYTVGVTL